MQGELTPKDVFEMLENVYNRIGLVEKELSRKLESQTKTIADFRLLCSQNQAYHKQHIDNVAIHLTEEEKETIVDLKKNDECGKGF